jgi:hypothetical protein
MPLCGGTATPADVHLLADIVAVDAGIIAWLEQREKQRGT